MSERRERGVRVYASQFGLPESEVETFFTSHFGERMAEEAFNASGGSAWDDGPLSLRDRSLVVLAALTALGGAEERMRPHVRWAIEHGATADEIDALVCLLAVYVGYARASVAMEVVRDELAALEAQPGP
ncbi:MAG: carboxymuconolactone decarboxylase family protein [Gaiellaceae bacterium]